MPQQSDVMREASPDLDASLRRGSFDLREIRAALDVQSHEERLRAIRSLSGKAQAQLFDAAKGAYKLTLDDIVPPTVAPLHEVPHNGKNSLPAFSLFAKVFCRPTNNAKELWGYNRSGDIVETFVGPGYYVAYAEGDEVMVDYTRTPSGKPESWPPMLSNHARLSRFVYADMVDALRAVSSHVSIGRAIRKGKVQDNWFVLCRSI
jgi:hypothetical protein